MHITAVPIGNIKIASSRIRCFRLMQFMPKEVDCKIINASEVLTLYGDVLYLQKVAYPNFVKLVKEYREKGGKVVYDLDDELGLWEGHDEKGMMDSVNVITTDTENRAENFRKLTSTPVYVIPDAIDYVEAKESPVIIRDDLLKIVTFGTNHSVEIAAPSFDFISNYEKFYIGEKPNRIRNCGFIKWKLKTFLINLKKHDIGILVHDANDSGSMKSNNRLLVCMSIGLPAIVSNTPAYSDTMRAAGTEFLIVNDTREISSKLKELKNKNIRQEISHKFIRYVWDNFPPESSSIKLFEVLRKL